MAARRETLDEHARLRREISAMRGRLWQPAEGRKTLSDRPEKIERPYRTHQSSSETCNPDEARQAHAVAAGLQHVTLPMALDLLPWDWRGDLTRYGAPSWEAVAQIAFDRAQREGLRPDAWSCAEAALGRSGAAVLALAAFAGAPPGRLSRMLGSPDLGKP